MLLPDNGSLRASDPVDARVKPWHDDVGSVYVTLPRASRSCGVVGRQSEAASAVTLAASSRAKRFSRRIPSSQALSNDARPENVDAGFTLLELLVALVVFGFVLAGLVGGLRFGLRAQDTQSRTIAAEANLGGTDRLLRSLVAEMDPGTPQTPPQIIGGEHAVGFVTDLGRAAAGFGQDGSAEIGLGIDSDKRLILRWQPVLHAVRLRPAAPPHSAVLLTGVDEVQFAFWSHGQDGAGSWQPRWAERGLPPLVRIRLRFAPDSHRHWPDIIVATQRFPAAG